MVASLKPDTNYTDSPELNQDLVLGSLQLLGWLFFHPTAWRNYIQRIAPELRPDFNAVQLTPAQRQQGEMRQLLIRVYVVIPLLIGSLIGSVLLLAGRAEQMNDLLYTVVLGTTGCFFLSLEISLAGGLAVGLIFGVVISFLSSLAANLISPSLLGSGRLHDEILLPGGVVVGLIIGLSSGWAGRTATRITRDGAKRLVAGAVSGVVLGLVGFAVVLGISLTLSTGANFGLQVLGITLGALIFGLTVGWLINLGGTRTRWRGAILGVVFSLAASLPALVPADVIAWLHMSEAGSIVEGARASMTDSIPLGIMFVLLYALAEPTGGPRAGAFASAVGGGIAWIGLLISRNMAHPGIADSVTLFITAGIVLGFVLAEFHAVICYPFLQTWNWVLYRIDLYRSSLPNNGHPQSVLHLHSAFWDEFQILPLIGLDRHVLLCMKWRPIEGRAALEYLITSHQRWAAQSVQIELDAQRLEQCATVEDIAYAHRYLVMSELEGSVSALLSSFNWISQDTKAALQYEQARNQRDALNTVRERLEGLLNALIRSSDPYALRLQSVVKLWRQILADHINEMIAAVGEHGEIESPYVVGLPLTDQEEIFVGRVDVSTQIEQLLLDPRQPPIFLYGQRRMGKTSLLNNMGRLLFQKIVPLFVDLQRAQAATSYAGFLFDISQQMTESGQRYRRLVLPPLTYDSLIIDPFVSFNTWLDKVELALGNSTALLMIDEIESLEAKIVNDHFRASDVLGMLRYMIQHRSKFKVLLAGSHSLEEYAHWSSYLINVRVVHLGYLKENEARKLVEQPVKHFSLHYEPVATQRILDLTHGHPYLVQLLCDEIAALKNEQDQTIRRLARLSDVEEAIPRALERGSAFFINIGEDQVDTSSLALLRHLADYGEQAVINRDILSERLPDNLDKNLRNLMKRELIEPANGGYRFQVELIRYWFASS